MKNTLLHNYLLCTFTLQITLFVVKTHFFPFHSFSPLYLCFYTKQKIQQPIYNFTAQTLLDFTPSSAYIAINF